MATVEKRAVESKAERCPGCGKVHPHGKGLTPQEVLAIYEALAKVLDEKLHGMTVKLPPGIPGAPEGEVPIAAAIKYFHHIEEQLQAEAERRLESLFRAMQEAERPVGFRSDGEPVRRGGPIPQEEKEPIGFHV